MFQWMSGHNLKGRFDEDIRKDLEAANIEKKNERESFKMVWACAKIGY